MYNSCLSTKVLILLSLLCFILFAEQYPQWDSNQHHYDSGAIVIYNGNQDVAFYQDTLWQAQRYVYRNTPPLESDNGWFWLPVTTDTITWRASHSYNTGDTVLYNDTIWIAQTHISPYTTPTSSSIVWEAYRTDKFISFSGVKENAVYSKWEKLNIDIDVQSQNKITSVEITLNTNTLTHTNKVIETDKHVIYSLPQITESSHGQSGINTIKIEVTDEASNNYSKSLNFEINDDDIMPYITGQKDDIIILNSNDNLSCHIASSHYTLNSDNTWLYNGCSFSFSPQWETSESGISLIKSGDIDGDGIKDLLYLKNDELIIRTISATDIATYHTGQFDDEIAVSTNIKNYTVGDFNRDGFDDIGVINNNDDINVYVTNYEPSTNTISFAAPQLVKNLDNVSEIHSGDFNGDGFADLLIKVANENKIQFFCIDPLNSPLLTFSEPPELLFNGNNLTIGDFTGDGVDDIAGIENSAVQIYPVSFEMGTDNVSLSSSPYTIPQSRKISNPNGLSAGDFNGDLVEDILLYTSDAYEIYSTSVTITKSNTLADLTFEAIEYQENRNIKEITSNHFGPVTEKVFFSSTHLNRLEDRVNNDVDGIKRGYFAIGGEAGVDYKAIKDNFDPTYISIKESKLDINHASSTNQLFNAAMYERFMISTGTNEITKKIIEIATEYPDYPMTNKKSGFSIKDASNGVINPGWLPREQNNRFEVTIVPTIATPSSKVLSLINNPYRYKKITGYTNDENEPIVCYQLHVNNSLVDLSAFNGTDLKDYKIVSNTYDGAKFTSQTLDEGAFIHNFTFAYDLLSDKFNKNERARVRAHCIKSAVDSVLITQSSTGSNWQNSINAGIASAGLLLRSSRYSSMSGLGTDLYIHDDRDNDNASYTYGDSKGYWSGFSEQIGELEPTREHFVEYDSESHVTYDQSISYQDYSIDLLVKSYLAFSLGNYHFTEKKTVNNTPLLSIHSLYPLYKVFSYFKKTGSDESKDILNRDPSFFTFGDGFKAAGLQNDYLTFIHYMSTKENTNERITHLFKRDGGGIDPNCSRKFEFLYGYLCYNDLFKPTSTFRGVYEPEESKTSQHLAGKTGVAILRSPLDGSKTVSSISQATILLPYNNVTKGVKHGHCNALAPSLTHNGIDWFTSHAVKNGTKSNNGINNLTYESVSAAFIRSSFGQNGILINGNPAIHTKSGQPENGVAAGSVLNDFINEDKVIVSNHQIYNTDGSSKTANVGALRSLYIDPKSRFIIDAIDITPVGTATINHFEMLYHFPVNATVTFPTSSSLLTSGAFRHPDSFIGKKLKEINETPHTLGHHLEPTSIEAIAADKVTVTVDSKHIIGRPIHGIHSIVKATTQLHAYQADPNYYDHPLVIGESADNNSLTAKGWDAIWIWILEPYDATTNPKGVKESDFSFDQVNQIVSFNDGTNPTKEIDLKEGTYMKRQKNIVNKILPIILED